MTKREDDPWSDIGRPSDTSQLSLRRVAAAGKWDFFWGRDWDARCALVLRVSPHHMPQLRLPQLKGIELKIQASEKGSKASLVIRLFEASQRDIFQQLCEDIVRSGEQAATEDEAVARTVTRTWRWHHLLRGGAGLLSASEQIGLMGELALLEHVFIPHCGPSEAMEAWRGPLGGVQDFSYGGLHVEAKARGPSKSDDVRISSEYQLTVPDGETLFLTVGIFEPADADGETVAEAAARVRLLVSALDVKALPRFDALLAAAGLNPDDDYSTWTWREKQHSVFAVREGFPRITPVELPQGVTGVRYGVSLSDCADFLVPGSELTNAVSEDKNA